jgi:hypothetical protein
MTTSGKGHKQKTGDYGKAGGVTKIGKVVSDIYGGRHGGDFSKAQVLKHGERFMRLFQVA